LYSTNTITVPSTYQTTGTGTNITLTHLNHVITTTTTTTTTTNYLQQSSTISDLSRFRMETSHNVKFIQIHRQLHRQVQCQTSSCLAINPFPSSIVQGLPNGLRNARQRQPKANPHQHQHASSKSLISIDWIPRL
jgi:hypothetical protein